MKKRSEDDLQIACMSYMRLVHTDLLAFHVPNGGNRSAREGAKFKRMGVLSGVPDILIMQPSGEYNGLAIELKIGKNKPSDNQIEVMNKLMACGWYVTIVRDLDHFMKLVDDYNESIIYNRPFNPIENGN